MRSTEVVTGFMLTLAAWSGCAHRPHAPAASNPVEESAPVAGYERDRDMAPEIAKALNSLFSAIPLPPQSNAAYDTQRMAELERRLQASTDPALVYFKTNRRYFDFGTDLGGQLTVKANLKRLEEARSRTDVKECLWRERRKPLLALTTRELIFCELYECGDAEDSGHDLDQLVSLARDFPEPQFRAENERLLHQVAQRLEVYRTKSWSKDIDSESEISQADVDAVVKPWEKKLKEALSSMEKRP